VLSLGALSVALPFQVSWQAFSRLVVAFFLVLIGPGYFSTRLMPVFTSLGNAITGYVLSLSVGYVLLTVLCGVLILFQPPNQSWLPLLHFKRVMSFFAGYRNHHFVRYRS
jgi:hypothetical protein